MIKIFHTADLHLDSPFSSLPPSQSEERRAGLRKIFTDMMSYAAKEKCDLVLIPGDLFDSSYVCRDTAEILREGFSKVGCPVVICPGNHDPYTPDSIYALGTFPPNVRIFSDESPRFFDFPSLGAAVWGAAFTRECYDNTPLGKIPNLNDGRIHILCQHGDLKKLSSRKCPLAPQDIAYRGFTYAALGHIHVAPEPITVGKTTIAYSGCPVGRSFDEPGFGGALLVTIGDDRSVNIERKLFADKRYMIEHLDITGVESDSELAVVIAKFIVEHNYGKETALRLILEGEVKPGFRPSVGALRRLCESSLDLLEIQDKTIPCFDTSYLENDMTLRGALYRNLAPKLHSEDEHERLVASEALRAGLAAIDNRAILAENTPDSIYSRVREIKEGSNEAY